MRNLKRALSLTLASVMLLGMMVIGTSAASYPDVTEEHNVEAIEVLQAVGVMSGSDSGNFNPDSKVSRVEMAVVMSNLLNLKVDYFENQCRFTDVPAWAGKYVAACEANGIVSGIGGDLYGTGDVTATQAALMMLKALGYFQYASDFGSNWAQETARLAANLSLFKGIEASDTTTLTRNQVAQLALNTLKSDVVVAEKNQADISVSVGDAVVDINGKVNYVITASNEPFASAIDSRRRADADTLNGVDGCVIQLGEKLYDGKLKLDDDAHDEFGRPARYWEYDGKQMKSYVKTELLKAEWHEKVTGRMLFDTLGSSLVNNLNRKHSGSFYYDLVTWVDGIPANGEKAPEYLDKARFGIDDITRTNTEKVGQTGNGALTQVFVDTQNSNGDTHQTVTVTVINTYLAEADRDYDAKKDELDLKVYNVEDKIVGSGAAYVKTHEKSDKTSATEIIKVTGADFEIEDIKKDEFFLVNIAADEIVAMFAPEIVSEVTLNSFKSGDWVKNDDVQYNYATAAQYDDEVLDVYNNVNMKDVTYNVILDQYGYLIGIELNEAVAQYLFMTGIDLGTSNLSKKNADANVIFTDGTMKTVTVNTDKSELAKKETIKQADGSTKDITLTNVSGAQNLTKMFPANQENYAQVNRWFTYTQDADGIYTVKEIGNYSLGRSAGFRTAKKVAQSFINAAATDSGEPNAVGEFEINGKNRSLNASEKDYNKVYGNADTVYINAKLTDISDKQSVAKQIVEKVDSVTTGVDNVDFTVKNIAGTGAPKDEAYVLYNSDGYVIACVILGAEDNGTSAKYAYITSDIKQEDYLGSNTWRWGVDAIIDGAIVRLTEVGDTQEWLKDGMKNKWYDVRFDKDGNVSSIKANDENDTAKPSEIKFQLKNDDKFIDDMRDVSKATNGQSPFSGKLNSLLLFQDFTCKTHNKGAEIGTGTAKLDYEAFTLYVRSDVTATLGLSPSTKIVVCLSKAHADGEFDSITAEFTGDQGMKDALKLLDSDQKSFDGYLGAVIKDGIATSIILDDRAGDKEKQGNVNDNQTPGQTGEATITLTASGFDFKDAAFEDANGKAIEVTPSNFATKVSFKGDVGSKYYVQLPEGAYDKASESGATVNITGRIVEITVNEKTAAATIKVTSGATEGVGPAINLDNAQAAITGSDSATGNILVAYQTVATGRANGTGKDGMPTKEEALAEIRYHLTEELGYNIAGEKLEATQATFTCEDDANWTVGTFTFTYASGLVKGTRYQDVTEDGVGYEIRKADGSSKFMTTQNEYYSFKVDGEWTEVTKETGTSGQTVPANTTEVETFEGMLTIEDVKVGVNKVYGSAKNALPSVKDLVAEGLIDTAKGTGVEKDASGKSYVAYTSDVALDAEAVIKAGYVKFDNKSGYAGITFNTNKTYGEVGKEVAIAGLGNGEIISVSVGGTVVVEKVTGDTSSTPNVTGCTIEAAKVTGDVVVSKLTSVQLTKALTNGNDTNGVTVDWYINGEKVVFGASDATVTKILATTDKLTATVTFTKAVDAVEDATTLAKLAVTGTGAKADWTATDISAKDNTSITFKADKAFAADESYTATITPATSGATTIEYTAAAK